MSEFTVDRVVISPADCVFIARFLERLEDKLPADMDELTKEATVISMLLTYSVYVAKGAGFTPEEIQKCVDYANAV